MKSERPDLRLLGPVEVLSGGTRVDLGPPQQRHLLAALLVDTGRVVAVDTLIDRLWDTPPAEARRNVYGLVTRLRRALAPVAAGDGAVQVVRRSGGYVCDAEPDQVDLLRFGRLVDAARQPDHAVADRIALLNEARGLWAGVPLSGLSGSWVARTRQSYQRRYVEATVTWAYAKLAAGEPDEVTGPVRELAGEYPFVESLHEVLMRALRAAGRPAEALEVFAALQRELAEQLGTDPGPDIQAVHQRILRGEPDAPSGGGTARAVTAAGPAPTAWTPVVPAQLPADVATFTGRSTALAQLDAVLGRSRADASPPPVAAVTGTAGVGKTTLVTHWAHRVSDQFPDGQLYVDLRSYPRTEGSTLSASDALAILLRGMGVPADQVPRDEQARAGLYRSTLAGRRVLVILDDAYAVDQVAPLLPGSPGCLVVVTSRHDMPGLIAVQDVEPVLLDVLPAQDAELLLRRIVGAAPVAAEPEAAAELAALCGYLPLALRIAAAHVARPPRWQLADYVRHLRRDRFGALATGTDRHTAVDSALHLSCTAIEPEPRRLFRLMGIAPGYDITPLAAAALTGQDFDQASRLLDRLAGAHLVEQRVRGRYGFHELLRGYAAGQCRDQDDPAECALAVRRLVGFYERTASAAADLAAPRAMRLPPPAADLGGTPLIFDQPAEASAWLDAERGNLEAIGRYAAAHGPYEVAWQLADALRQYFWLSRSTREWLAITEAGLRAAVAAGDRTAEAVTRGHLGVVHWTTGDFAAALEEFERALHLDQQLGLTDRAAGMLGNIGSIHRETGNLDQCLDYTERACEVFRKSGNRLGEANARITLAGMYEDHGQLDRVAEEAAWALRIYRQENNQDGMGSALLYLGSAALKRGEWSAAVGLAEQAADTFEQLGAPLGHAWALQLMGEAALGLGDLDHARRAADGAVQLARQAGNDLGRAEALVARAAVDQADGQPEQAYRRYTEARSLARAGGTPLPEVNALLGRARLPAHSAGAAASDWRPADDAATALDAARRAGYRLHEGEALISLARIRLDAGDLDDAAAHAGQALEVLAGTGAEPLIAAASTIVARAVPA